MLRRSKNKELGWLVLGAWWLTGGMFPTSIRAQQGLPADPEQVERQIANKHWWDIFTNKPEAVLIEEKVQEERAGRWSVYNEEQIRRERFQASAVNEQKLPEVERFRNSSFYRREERRARTEKIRELEEKRQQETALSPQEENIRPPLSDARSRRQSRIDRAKAIKAREEAQQDNP